MKVLKSLVIWFSCSILCFGLSATSAAQDGPPKTLILSECQVGGVKGSSECGTYEVYEDRVRKSGRKISLKIVRLLATDKERHADPLFYISGGPGSSATNDVAYIAEVFERVRVHRDLVFVDQRGTGGSNPLDCELYTSRSVSAGDNVNATTSDVQNESDLQRYFAYFLPLEDVRKCRERLERKNDLTLYTTSIAMDDLDEVRSALGYEQINLVGISYGTRAALVYLKRHPKHVRTVSLYGVSPTNHYVPRTFAPDTERALQGVLAECAADELCNTAFPNLRTETREVLARLLKRPVEVAVRVPSPAVSPVGQGNGTNQKSAPTVKYAKVKFSRDLAAEAIRYMLYSPAVVPQIPLFIHAAAAGDFGPLAEAALRYRVRVAATGSFGMYLSVTCAEDIPWIKPGEGERLAANTFLGDYRLRQHREACALWPRGQIPPDYHQPVHSSVPALLFTGQWDPATPPAHGKEVARHLPNSLHVVVPQGAHAFSGLSGIECMDRLNAEFIERGTTKGLDTSCVGVMKRKAWMVAFK